MTQQLQYQITSAETSDTGVKEPSVYQESLFSEFKTTFDSNVPYVDRLCELLSGDLSFRGYDTSYASHDLHSFPAKFPPQLPQRFILGLTRHGEVVLDPMMGSGTTIVEACLADRQAIGFDIDPMARLITQVKTKSLDAEAAVELGREILKKATSMVQTDGVSLSAKLETRWDEKTKAFVDYWFAPETKVELMALITQIEKISDSSLRAFFELVFSACIITKSGGVSLAFDLAHTRPHKAKVVLSPSGMVISGDEHRQNPTARTQFLTKTLRSPLVEFQKRFQQNVKSLIEIRRIEVVPRLDLADAQRLPLKDNIVDLVVTSPPYASNAIDYMRAHKFSLVWLGYRTDELTDTRKLCIGGEGVAEFSFEDLPPHTATIVKEISQIDADKGSVLHRYYSEMNRVLREIHRVLKPGKAAVVIVASSNMRGIDTQTDKCLAEIGETVGLSVPKIGIRQLDRDRRMMPAGMKIDYSSQIQQRMHEEYVIGFFKAES